MKRGLASGTVLYTDSTHLKANANKNKYDVAEVAVKPAEYLAALDAAIAEDRAAHGKSPLKPAEAEPGTKQIKVSRTDPDSGYMVRGALHRLKSGRVRGRLLLLRWRAAGW